jgi:hypothetical protein
MIDNHILFLLGRMYFMKSKNSIFLSSILSLSGLAFIFMFNTTAKAQDANLAQCIQQYSTMGISPDAALAECKKTSLRQCVERLTKNPIVARAVEPFVQDKNGRYLVDLGDNENRWLEGPGWRAKSCQANTQGIYKRQSDNNRTFWNNQRSFEWFRQGWCESQEIVLDQNYSLDEATNFCELGIGPAKTP